MRPQRRAAKCTRMHRRYRQGPGGPPRLDRSPGVTTIAVLSCLSSQPRTPEQIREDAGLASIEQVYRVIHRVVAEYNIPIVLGYALAAGPRTPSGQDIREWIVRHLHHGGGEDISACNLGTEPEAP